VLEISHLEAESIRIIRETAAESVAKVVDAIERWITESKSSG
jgi:hypothetical protein